MSPANKFLECRWLYDNYRVGTLRNVFSAITPVLVKYNLSSLKQFDIKIFPNSVLEVLLKNSQQFINNNLRIFNLKKKSTRENVTHYFYADR